jgi:hypothetical protein
MIVREDYVVLLLIISLHSWEGQCCCDIDVFIHYDLKPLMALHLLLHADEVVVRRQWLDPLSQWLRRHVLNHEEHALQPHWHIHLPGLFFLFCFF